MTSPAQIPSDDWLAQLRSTVIDGYCYLDHLTAIDRLQTIEVVAVLRRPDTGEERVLSTSVSSDAPELASACALLPAANWHEREAAELFGMVFTEHPDPRPLLTRRGGAGERPPLLLKSTPLPARLSQPWPGADGGRRTRVPGVSDAWIGDTAHRQEQT